MNAKLPTTVGLFLGALLLVAGCNKPHEEAKPDEAQNNPPALSKPAHAQGDPEKAVDPTHPEAKTAPDPEEHGPEPVRKDDDADDDTSDPKAKAHEGRHRASSGPASTRDRTADAKSSPITVKRILFSEEIDKREPVTPEETFSAAQTDKIYAFVELGNATKEKSHVSVSFIPPMGKTSKVELDVGNKKRWRTWARRAKPTAVGTWTVVVSDDAGTELGRRTFEVTE